MLTDFFFFFFLSSPYFSPFLRHEEIRFPGRTRPLLMAHVRLLLVWFVFGAVARTSKAASEPGVSTDAFKDSGKVFTTSGKECKFPFRHGGRIHHHCISTSKPWCSLTHNYDRDRLWGFCAPEENRPEVFLHSPRRIGDPCRPNPCQNGGVCGLVPRTLSFECFCPESFTGRLCEQRKCYETTHLRFYDIGESWGRIHLRNVEQCSCVEGEIQCQRVYYTTCHSNPCQNDGTCRLITSTRKEVCHCRSSYAGPHCDLPFSLRTFPFRVSTTVKKPISTTKAKSPTCGMKHKKRLTPPRGRILGGSSALPGSHPWMAAIYIGKSDFCGGSLISSCWIVSAAHCFNSNPLYHQVRVVLGQHYFNNTRFPSNYSRTFEVEKIIYPKHFSVFNPTLHDIVLIKLKKQDGRCVRKSPFIRPICLPEKNMPFPDGYCCTISGWGYTQEKAREYSPLQEAKVRLIPHETCRKPEVYGNHVTSDMICAGLDCVDACQGDSGGPLACAKGDVSFLYGIISWGEGCGRVGKPGVYTKVVNYIDWIQSVIKRKAKAS
ncbi:hepatocyte growth factor activator isoform X3 [Oryzias melastigma]|uniref:hepatocyte growth factor activator isoform X3 n=1 Tax=Oryzias melastigma TaxID=30732 RepID=UPI000CF7C508|nr:hepatocyte growth factor activator isoform X3 [Oryzias melastigma]